MTRSGLDFATWTLPAGRYRFVIYPREDGTAVDAFYLAGPGVSPPNSLTLNAGASTTSACSADRLSVDPDGVGRGATHGGNDASGWAHWTHRGSDYDPSVNAGTGCGHCLEPIAQSECPAADVLETMITCDTVELGELCEADGERAWSKSGLRPCGASAWSWPPQTDLPGIGLLHAFERAPEDRSP